MLLDYKTAFVCSSGNVCCFCLGFCLTQEHSAVVEIVGVGDKLVVIFFHIYYILQGGWSCVSFYFPFASADFRLLRPGVVITPLWEDSSECEAVGRFVGLLSGSVLPAGRETRKP